RIEADLAVTSPTDAPRPRWRLPDWTPQPKQQEFLSCPAGELLYGGAAGGGKTSGLANWAIRFLHPHPGAQVILCRTKPTQMRDIGAILPQTDALLRGKGWLWREKDMTWTAPDGGKIAFKQVGQNVRETEDNWQGAAPEALGIEEAGQMRADQLNFMIGRV